MSFKPAHTGVPIPWWIKIILKIVLSRLPFGYDQWRQVGLFRHGKMDQVNYVQNVFEWHVQNAGFGECLQGKTLLELGPGDSIATAIIAACYDARAIMIDSGDYALRDVSIYKSFALTLKERGLDVPELSSAETREDILQICKASYLCDGLSSFEEIADKSIDLIFSQAVLEHIPRGLFMATMQESHRVLKSDGVASHFVDLKDHLGGGLNNLRFSAYVWESDIFINSGFYTNRIRFSEMISMFQYAGFRIESVNLNRWELNPIRKKNLSKDFEAISDDDLLVNGFDVRLIPV